MLPDALILRGEPDLAYNDLNANLDRRPAIGLPRIPVTKIVEQTELLFVELESNSTPAGMRLNRASNFANRLIYF